MLANVDTDLCAQVAAGLGLPAPAGNPPKDVWARRRCRRSSTRRGRSPAARSASSRAPTPTWPASPSWCSRSSASARLPLVIAPLGGVLKSGGRSVIVDRTLLTTRSIEYDAFVVAGGTTPTSDIKLIVLLQEAFRHCKAMGAWGDGSAALAAAGIDLDAAGVLVGRHSGQVVHRCVGGRGRPASGVGARRRGDGFRGGAGALIKRGRAATLLTVAPLSFLCP